MGLSNEGCREQAILAIKRGDYDQAIAWINSAYAKTIGHKKSARYEAWAKQIAKEQGIEVHSRYANDSDAVYA